MGLSLGRRYDRHHGQPDSHGMLAVNIGDAKTHKLLWLGDARDTLSDNPEKNTKKINKALGKMFKKYPPPSN